MQKLNIIELKNIHENIAFTKGQIQPYVRENYINKFKERLPNDLFGLFSKNAYHNTQLQLTGNNSECLIIETDMFQDENDIISAVKKANGDSKVSGLFTNFYSLDIDILSICLRHDQSQAFVFLLRSPTDIKNLYENELHKKYHFNIIN